MMCGLLFLYVTLYMTLIVNYLCLNNDIIIFFSQIDLFGLVVEFYLLVVKGIFFKIYFKIGRKFGNYFIIKPGLFVFY